jgi:hypothetical protein
MSTQLVTNSLAFRTKIVPFLELRRVAFAVKIYPKGGRVPAATPRAYAIGIRKGPSAFRVFSVGGFENGLNKP